MPLFKCPDKNSDGGYAVSTYREVNPALGTMEQLRTLADDLRAEGISLCVDFIFNHTSDEHPWFIASRSARDDPKRDWYIWRDDKDGGPPNNWESIFRGSAWQYDAGTEQYYLHLFTVRQPDLNWENPAVREALFAMVRWWADKGVDGIRLDAVSHMKKAPGLPDMPNPQGLAVVPSYPYHMNVDGVRDYLDALCEGAFRGRDLMTVGEANGVSARDAEAWVLRLE